MRRFINLVNSINLKEKIVFALSTIMESNGKYTPKIKSIIDPLTPGIIKAIDAKAPATANNIIFTLLPEATLMIFDKLTTPTPSNNSNKFTILNFLIFL